MIPSRIGSFGGRSRSVAISSNQTNYNLFTALGSPTTPVDVVVTVNSGVIISSNSTSTPAFDEGSLPLGSTVKLINLGKIYGMGGVGGSGGSAANSPSRAFAGSSGSNGGVALKLTCPTVVVNASGEIFGGGGGGGGGGGVNAYDSVSNVYVFMGGGGGGGGRSGSNTATSAGGSVSGANFNYSGSSGVVGTSSSKGTGGSGGDGTPSGLIGQAANGGSGGEWGSSGDTASTPSNPGVDVWIAGSGGSGGDAGKSVDLNGQSITWISGNDSTHVKGPVS